MRFWLPLLAIEAVVLILLCRWSERVRPEESADDAIAREVMPAMVAVLMLAANVVAAVVRNW